MRHSVFRVPVFRVPVFRVPVFRVPVLLVAVAGLVVGGCGSDGDLGGPTLGGAVAAQVGSFDYTSADLEAEVEAWAASPSLVAQAFTIEDLGEPGRRSAAFVAGVLQFRVLSEQSRQLSADTGYVPTPDELAALADQISQSFPDPATGGSLLDAYEASFLDQLATDISYQQNLATVDAGVSVPAEVSINPRYGTFVDQDRGLGQVVPPTGPRPQTPTFEP